MNPHGHGHGLLHRHVLQRVFDASRLDARCTASRRAVFGLGLTVGERHERARTVSGGRFCVNFRLPAAVQSAAMNSLVYDGLQRWLAQDAERRAEASLFAAGNVVSLECAPADAVSRMPSSGDAETAAAAAAQQHLAAAATGVRMETLAVDPSPLYELLGLERPLSPSSSHSPTFAMLGSGSSSNGSPRVISPSSSGAAALLPPGSANGTLQLQRAVDNVALRPWELQNVPFGEYRRNLYRVGTDSVFALAGDAVPRPIRLLTTNFVSFEADKHLFSPRSPKTNAKAATDNFDESDASNIEEAWFNAIRCTKRALEASSTLLHERAVVCCLLLRRRQPRGGAFDSELDHFVRGTRSAFGSADVVSLLPKQQQQNQQQQQGDSPLASAYEPVMVVCSDSASGSAQRTSLVEILPHARQNKAGVLVNGGNMEQLFFKRKQQQKEQEQASATGGEKARGGSSLFVRGYGNDPRFPRPASAGSDAQTTVSAARRRQWKPARNTLGHRKMSPAKHFHTSLMPGRRHGRGERMPDAAAMLRRREAEKKLEQEAAGLAEEQEEKQRLRNN